MAQIGPAARRAEMYSLVTGRKQQNWVSPTAFCCEKSLNYKILTEKSAGVEQDINSEINRGYQGDNKWGARTGSLRDSARGRSAHRFRRSESCALGIDL